jgi:pyruvate dehydrogenase E1 component
MGLGPIQAIYHARFIKYLENRGLKQSDGQQSLGVLGDGKRDGRTRVSVSITLASREKLDNLIFVVNCNLQRLDGPVRGNGKIIRRRSSVAPAGTSSSLHLGLRLGQPHPNTTAMACWSASQARVSDGQYQKSSSRSSAYFRQNLFGTDPRLLKMVEHLSDDQLARMRLERTRSHQSTRSVSAQPSITLDLRQSFSPRPLKATASVKLGRQDITHQQKN